MKNFIHRPLFAEKLQFCFSLLAIILALVLPTLLVFHSKPQPTFVMEVVLALLLFLGLSLTSGSKPSLMPGHLVPLTLFLLLGVTIFGDGSLAYAYATYILLFWVAYSYGTAGIVERAVMLGLFAGAAFQSVLVFMQIFGLGGEKWILSLVNGRAVGNVGQPNSLGDLLLFGMAALCHPAFGRLKWGLKLLIAAGLGLALAATGSRSAWLGIAIFGIIGLRCKVAAEWNAGAGLLLIACVAAAMQFLFPLLQYFGLISVTGAIFRAGISTSNSARWYLVKISLEAIKSSPWFGHGAGSFWRISVDALQDRPAREYSMLIEHAHNLPLNLAVEFGLPVSILVCGVLLFWGYSRLRMLSSERAWALACVGLVFAHGLVEYPFWYAFLLVPCALCMGIVDAGQPPSRFSIRWPTGCLRVVGLIGLWVSLASVMDWMHVRLAWQRLVSSDEMTARVMSLSARDELEQVSRFSVFGQQVESLRLQSYRVGQDDLELALRDCEEHWEERPTWFMLKSCGEVFSAANRPDLLQRLVNVQCKGYPMQRELLHEWAVTFDAGGQGKLKLVGRACL